MKRREFLHGIAGAAAARSIVSPGLFALPAGIGFQLRDVTAQAGISFQHNSGAYGGKLLPETLGSGCAFLDYDGDGWQDILLVNAMDWPGHKKQKSTLKLYKNNRNGSFSDVTRAAGLEVELYGMGVAVGDYNNDGFADVLITCVGQNRLFQNTGRGTFIDVTKKSGLLGRQAFSTSALWFDYDRDGLLDLFVCNYVNWSPEHDVFCSLDGKHKSYCTPEAYRGETCWLFRNRGDGTFEDATATSGVFDASSKSLGVALLDFDRDGWPDLLVANDTQPNKLYKNLRNGKFKDVGMEAGVAFSPDGKARAGMGVAVGDFENSGRAGIAITNFDNEMVGLYRAGKGDAYDEISLPSGVGGPSKTTLGFGCAFLDIDLDGRLDLAVANGHIDETVRNIRGNVGYAQPPQLFLNQGGGKFREAAGEAGAEFAKAKVGRGLAYGDFDRDGDLDILLTTNNGPAYLYRNDESSGNRAIRFYLTGRKSNRDAIGAVVRIFNENELQMRMVHGGSSYLSQSELPVTFGVGKRDRIERVVVDWPSGATQEFKNLASGKGYQLTENKDVVAMQGF
ncbi:MAG: CRTAC1 family protein [Acidobacteria bacterium]|nr:CRTAC1 family protein [Acidobacteriota bacterium]MBS1867171.1 CRTAC1 family protein [Acidobacteriota bacterium]